MFKKKQPEATDKFAVGDYVWVLRESVAHKQKILKVLDDGARFIVDYRVREIFNTNNRPDGYLIIDRAWIVKYDGGVK